MYYHQLSLRYVEYGTIVPQDDESGRNRSAYQWLGHYCGYFPQIWLSRANINLTGYRSDCPRQGSGGRQRREVQDRILFGFDQIHGFPVICHFWHGFALNAALYADGFEEINESVMNRLDCGLESAVEQNGDRLNPDWYELEIGWRDVRPNLAEFLRKYAFVERDQFVVPSLNLKTAKRILCRNERQKKALRQMGFIEDRIEVRNMPRW